MSRQRDVSDESTDEDDEDIPLHHKKPFGAGLKRQRVEFVRATDSDSGVGSVTKTSPSSAVGDVYASIVFGDGTGLSTPQSAADPGIDAENASICAVCSFPITTSVKEHEASVAHQVNIPHAHPPSALDRSRMGLRALESLGWDPDARRGLGREGEGLRYPVKAKAKDDTLGIGATRPDKSKQEPKQQPSPRKLTGKELKEEAVRDKQRAERLQAEIYGRVDVESYLWRAMDE